MFCFTTSVHPLVASLGFLLCVVGLAFAAGLGEGVFSSCAHAAPAFALLALWCPGPFRTLVAGSTGALLTPLSVPLPFPESELAAPANLELGKGKTAASRHLRDLLLDLLHDGVHHLLDQGLNGPMNPKPSAPLQSELCVVALPSSAADSRRFLLAALDADGPGGASPTTTHGPPPLMAEWPAQIASTSRATASSYVYAKPFDAYYRAGGPIVPFCLRSHITGPVCHGGDVRSYSR